MSARPTPDADEARGTTDEAEPEGFRLAKDDAFHLLQNARRRAVLRYMVEHDEAEYRMRDLAEAVAAWENDTTVRQLSSDERQRVYIGLYQSHLPKLADHGVVEYDQNRGVVRPTAGVDLLAPYVGTTLRGESERLTAEEPDPGVDEDDGADRGLAGVLALLSN